MKKLIPLFVIQFFTWLGLFSLWIYATPAIARQFFGGGAGMEEATKWVGICFALYSILGVSLAFILNKILKIYPKYLVHSLCLFVGALGLMSVYFFQSKNALLISFVLIGVSWASISTTPYQLVGTMAPEENSEKFYSVFNFSTVIPQVVASFLLSFLTKNYFDGDMLKTIFTGGIFFLIAAIISFFIYLNERKN